MPGYASCFTRFTPYVYRPAYYTGVWGHYHGHHHGFSFGFGFYRGCYAYPTYPLVYYPTYYAPLYPVYPVYPTYYVSSVLVTTPTYTYVPEPVVEYTDAAVVTTEYATTSAYVAQGGQVEAPVVTYGHEYDAGYAQQTPQYQGEPQQQAQPSQQYVEAPPAQAQPSPNVYVENHVHVQGQTTLPQSGEAQPAPVPAGPSGVEARSLPAEPQQVMPAQPAVPGWPVQPPAEAPAVGEPAPAPAVPQTVEPQTADQQPAEQQGLEPQAGEPQAAAPAGGERPGEPGAEQGEELPPLTPEQIKELQDLMVGGTNDFSEGRYAEAADKFEKVVQVDPYNIDAALANGIARFAKGEYSHAADCIRLGVSLFPPIVDSVFDVRERYSKPADFVNQLRALEDHLDRNPQDADALVVLGFVRHFSKQRDLGEQTFRQLKKLSPDDAELADVFLNAPPPQAVSISTTQPAAGGEPVPGTLDVRINRDVPGIPSTQASGLDALPDGPAVPGVLSVTTRPAAMQKIEIPVAPVFDGKLSLTDAAVPREQTTVDGIAVRLKSTDDPPPQAFIEISVDGKPAMKVKRFIPGAYVVVESNSGQSYKLVLTEVDNKTETIRYMMDKFDPAKAEEQEAMSSEP
ncbi:MAG TPA: hypothetical protein PKL76_15705 [Phycisphaerae bacterium]|nr:hypothetical protein [Phycisphaerae bacterium]